MHKMLINSPTIDSYHQVEVQEVLEITPGIWPPWTMQHLAILAALLLGSLLRQRDSINASIEEKMRSNNMELPQLVISKIGTTWKGSMAQLPLVLVYHGPLRSHLLGVAPSTFTIGCICLELCRNTRKLGLYQSEFSTKLLCFAFLVGVFSVSGWVVVGFGVLWVCYARHLQKDRNPFSGGSFGIESRTNLEPWYWSCLLDEFMLRHEPVVCCGFI